MTLAPPFSILVLSGRYHIMLNASIVNNCIMLNSLSIEPVKMIFFAIFYNIDKYLLCVNISHGYIICAEIFEKMSSGGLEVSFSIYQFLNPLIARRENVDPFVSS